LIAGEKTRAEIPADFPISFGGVPVAKDVERARGIELWRGTQDVNGGGHPLMVGVNPPSTNGCDAWRAGRPFSFAP
jgi:hypothetical protein